MAKARKFGLGGTIKKVAEKAVEKKDPALDSVRKKQADLAKKGIAADPPRTPGGKVIAVPAVKSGTNLSPKDKGLVVDPIAPGAKDTSATGPSKGVISKVVELAKTAATQKPDVAPSVKSTGMPRPAPSTPSAEKGLGAVGKTLSAKELMGIVGGPKLSGKASVMPKMSGPLASGGGGALSPDANTDLGRQMIAGARAKINDTTTSDDFIPRTPRTPLGFGGISGALQKLTSQAGTGMKKGGKTSCYSSGGSTSGASKRGDGIAIRGKTRGKIC